MLRRNTNLRRGESYDEFVERSTQRAKNRKVGDPFDKTSEQGPQVSNIFYSQNSLFVKLFTRKIYELSKPCIFYGHAFKVK